MKVVIVHREGEYVVTDIPSNRIPRIGDSVDFFENLFPSVSMILRIYNQSTFDGLRALLTTTEFIECELDNIEMVIMVE